MKKNRNRNAVKMKPPQGKLFKRRQEKKFG